MKHLDHLKSLNLPAEQFAIFGSGPMVIKGMHENNDIDVIVKNELWDALKKTHKPILKNNKKTEYIEIGEIEIFPNWKPWFDDVDELIDTADIIDGIRFVKLEHVLTWKK